MKLKDSDITITLECLPEDIPVQCNAMASGDDAYDKQVEDEINRRLDQGDMWAWCCVKVTAHHEPSGLEGVDYLGGCNYADEDDFKAGGYYQDMVSQAKTALEAEIKRMRKAVCGH